MNTPVPPRTPTPKRSQKEDNLKVFGNFFYPEMRSVCALLELNEIPFSCETVNIFSREGKSEYQGFNPTLQMPTIIEGLNTVIGDPPSIIRYLCRSQSIDEKFYPIKDMNKDKRKIIDGYLEYVNWVVRRNADRILKLKLQRHMIERGIVEKIRGYKEEDEEKEKDIFFDVIIFKLEQLLQGGKLYLCGYDLSIADIAFFNSILNTIEILELNIDQKLYPCVDKWMRRIEDLAPVRVLNMKFIEEYKLLKEIYQKQ